MSMRQRMPIPVVIRSTRSRTSPARSLSPSVDSLRGLRVHERDHPCGCVPDSEQPALALRDDLEPNRALVEPRMELLELAQRRPLRLAHRLAGRFDLAQVLRHRLAFFLRFTRRGWCRSRRLLVGRLRLGAVLAFGGHLLRRRARGAFRRRRRLLRDQLARDQPLADRPQVRRHPVDDEPDREVHEHRNERDREHHHHRPLRLVHGRGHEVRGRELAPDVDREQQVARPVRVRVRRDVRDERAEPGQVSARRILRELPQHEVERDEDGELDEERQAGSGRVDVVVPVELHELFVALLLVVLEALLDRLHLRHVRLHRLHRVDLLDGERDHAAAARRRSPRRSPRPRGARSSRGTTRGRSAAGLRAAESGEKRIT